MSNGNLTQEFESFLQGGYKLSAEFEKFRRQDEIREQQARFRAQREPVEQGRPLLEGIEITGISALPDVEIPLPVVASRRDIPAVAQPTLAIPVRPGEGVTGISAAETGGAIARKLMPEEIPPEELTPAAAAVQAFTRGSAEDSLRILGGIADFLQSKEGLATAAVSVAGGPPASAAMLTGLALGSASELPSQIEVAKQDPTPENVGVVLENAAFVALLTSGANGVARLQERIEARGGKVLASPLIQLAQERLDRARMEQRGIGEGAVGPVPPRIEAGRPVETGLEAPRTLPPKEAEIAAPRPTERPAAPKPIYEMTVSELGIAEKADKEKDVAILKSLFGEDGARRYQSLEATANSPFDIDRADKASAELDKMHAKLTPEQQRSLFGLDEAKAPTWEDYRQFKNALGQIGGETPKELGSSLRWAITRVGELRDPSRMTFEEQKAYAQLRQGFRMAAEEGWNLNEVYKSALRGATERFGPEAPFMLEQFLKIHSEAEAKVRPAVEEPALPAERPQPRVEAAGRPILPGMERAVEEQRTDAARVQGEQLTGEFAQPIEERAGKAIEQAPIFRGTKAAAQKEIFAGVPTTEEVRARAMGEKTMPVENILAWARGEKGYEEQLGPVPRNIKTLSNEWKKNAGRADIQALIERDLTKKFKDFASGEEIMKQVKKGGGRAPVRQFGDTDIAFGERLFEPWKIYSNPLTAIAEIYTKTIGRPLWEKGSALLLRMTPEFVKRGMVNRYGQPAEFVEAHIQAKTEAALGIEKGLEFGMRLTEKLPQPEQQALGRFMAGEMNETELRQMRNDAMMNHAIEAAKQARAEIDNLGGQAVTQGLLSDETFFRNYGKYLPRMYRKWEIDYEEMLRKTETHQPTRLDLDRFRKRQDIPADVRLMMGEILEPGYPVAKGIAQLSHDVAFAKLFNRVAENPEWAAKDLDTLWTQGKDASEFVQMPTTKRLGKLSRMYVNKYIADELNQAVRSRGELDKLVRQLVSEWKFGKVILNPSTHSRNMMSNAILAYLGGLPPTRVDIYYKALRELRDKGEVFERAKADGLTRATFVEGELDVLLDSWNQGAGSLSERFAKMQENLKKGRILSQFGTSQKLAQLYQAEEVWFKLAKYIHNLEKGMSSKEAVADAHKWLFDYSEVPKWVDWSRRSPIGAPFLTFTYKALPRVAESVVVAPWRMAGILGTLWLMQDSARKTLGYTEDELEKLKEILPSRMRGPAAGVIKFLLLPWKDKYGQLQFLDLTYILPWGDIGETGGMGREYIEKVPGVRQVAGLVRQVPIAGSPFILAVSEIGMNKSSFTGREIYKPYDDWKKQTADITAHLYRTLAPSLAPGGYGERRLTKTVTGEPDYFGRTSSLLAAIASTIAGLKITPVEPKREYEFRILEMRRTLEDIAKEARSISYNQGLTPEEKNERLAELQAKFQEIQQKAQSLEVPQGAR